MRRKPGLTKRIFAASMLLAAACAEREQARASASRPPDSLVERSALPAVRHPPAEVDPAGGKPVGPPPGLEVRGAARVEGDHLVVDVIIANVSDQEIEVTHGACAPVVRLYRDGADSSAPAWRSDPVVVEGFGEPVIVCPAIAFSLQLPPGQVYTALEMQSNIPVRKILGDSLPGGRYTVLITPEVGGSAVGPVPAGAVILRPR